MWIWILIIFVVGGALLGFLSSNDKDKGDGCLGGALIGLIQGGSCLFQLLMLFLTIMFVIWIFS